MLLRNMNHLFQDLLVIIYIVVTYKSYKKRSKKNHEKCLLYYGKLAINKDAIVHSKTPKIS